MPSSVQIGVVLCICYVSTVYQLFLNILKDLNGFQKFYMHVKMDGYLLILISHLQNFTHILFVIGFYCGPPIKHGSKH